MHLFVYPLIVLISSLLLNTTYASLNEAIAIKDLSSRMQDEEIIIFCEIHYQLDDKVKEALSNGIAMTFSLEIELMQSSPYLFNKLYERLNREFTIKYHALSKQYVMQQTGSETEYSFPDLYSAFYFQRYLHNASFENAASLENNKNYYFRARARLVSEQLPLPLRIKSYLSKSWRPSSGWTIWPI